MAITIKVAILLLGLVVICTAGVSNHQAADTIGPYSKNVLLGRALSAQRRGMYNNGCNLEACWDAFYREAFKDLSTCNTAWSELEKCVESGLKSQDLCKCNFHQVDTGVQLDDMCNTLHSSYFGRCADNKAQDCVVKMTTLSQSMQADPGMSAADRKAMVDGVKDCVEEVMEDGLDTSGCDYMFLKDDMLDMHLMIAKAWSEGCSINQIVALCPSPEAETPEHCSDEEDIVGTFLECAKKELTSEPCQNFLPEVEETLNKFKSTKCTKINQIHKTIKETCGTEGRKRTLLKRLLNLLQTQEK